MSLYPSLEDMKVDQFIQDRSAPSASPSMAPALPDTPSIAPAPPDTPSKTPAPPDTPSKTPAPPDTPSKTPTPPDKPSKTPTPLDKPSLTSAQEDEGLYPRLYPALTEFMGFNLTEDVLHQALSVLPAADCSVAVAPRPSCLNYMRAPITGQDCGVRRAEIQQGVREVILCKDADDKIGLRLKSVDNGVFVQLVQAHTAAALGGLRFGDQVLQINGQNCAGWSSDKAHKVLKNASAERITFVVRDRPFERTITLHKDINGQLGFIFKKGKITSIVKDSSAARNGLLTDHHLCEVNGQNVIGLKDPQVSDILNTSGGVTTVTVMPSAIFEHMMKKMSSSIVKSLMDHSVPEV